MRRSDPFPGVGKAEMAARINDARQLDNTDLIIARMALLDSATFSEIAACAHCERSTVGRRYRRLIKLI